MSKFEKIAIVLLSVGTIASGWTAIEVTRIVNDGLSMEISVDEAQAAEADMEGE